MHMWTVFTANPDVRCAVGENSKGYQKRLRPMRAVREGEEPHKTHKGMARKAAASLGED